MVKKFLFALLWINILVSPATACVLFNVDEYWRSSQMVAIGLVTSASMFDKDGYPYVRYTISDPEILKGNPSRSRSLKVIAKSDFSPLRVGQSFIIFITGNGHGKGQVHSCGPTRMFDKSMLDENYTDFGSEEEEAFVEELRKSMAQSSKDPRK